jgi:hypothetical protein
VGPALAATIVGEDRGGPTTGGEDHGPTTGGEDHGPTTGNAPRATIETGNRPTATRASTSRGGATKANDRAARRWGAVAGPVPPGRVQGAGRAGRHAVDAGGPGRTAIHATNDRTTRPSPAEPPNAAGSRARGAMIAAETGVETGAAGRITDDPNGRGHRPARSGGRRAGPPTEPVSEARVGHATALHPPAGARAPVGQGIGRPKPEGRSGGGTSWSRTPS